MVLATDQICEPVEVNWFGNDIVHPGGEACFLFFLGVMCGQTKDTRRRIGVTTYYSGRLKTIHGLHLDIHK
ncbi:MAG: hypothetical protein WD558_00170, partial [Pseudomonadales bacterium]